MVTGEFECRYDGFEGYLIEKDAENIEDAEVFLVQDKEEAEDITDYLNKQLKIIKALEDNSYNNVEVIEMKLELDKMIEFHSKYKHERVINNIYYDVLTQLRRRWFG